jgi:hypothetical protein
MPFAKLYPGIKITNKVFDASWAELLKDPPSEWRIPYRHPTALDRRFAKLDFSLSGKPSRFSFVRVFDGLLGWHLERRVS